MVTLPTISHIIMNTMVALPAIIALLDRLCEIIVFPEELTRETPGLRSVGGYGICDPFNDGLPHTPIPTPLPHAQSQDHTPIP